jgi:RNA polymerase sigma-70 factor (sigma-E family)
VIADVVTTGERGGLVQRVSADDAVTDLYAAYYRSLVRTAALLLGQQSHAEEIVQDAFVAMHGKWGRLRDPDKAAAYLRSMVVNRSRSALRRRVVEDKHRPLAGPDEPSAEYGALVLLERDRVMTALRTLPGRQREALVLRYYADLSEAEIADAMGISRGAVKSHASRGLAALRNVLEDRPGGPTIDVPEDRPDGPTIDREPTA